MASIEKRLREWAATLWDRELDDEDKDTLFDDLTQAADEIESLMEDLEVERKKHEWVSVKDRLPKEDCLVHIAIQYENGTVLPSLGWYHTESGEWMHTGSDKDKVVMWHPFPDPPICGRVFGRVL